MACLIKQSEMTPDTAVPQRPAAELLSTAVQFLRGVGPQKAKLLEKLGLHTVRDILFRFPRGYQDHTDLREVHQLEENKLQTVCGVVEEAELRGTGPGRSVLGVLVRCGPGFLRALWFNQAFMQDRFSRGQRVLVSGKPKLHGLVWEMSHPRVDFLPDESEGDGKPVGRIEPVYSLTEGIQQWQMRRIVDETLEHYAELVEEIFSAEYLQAHTLLPIDQALSEIHFPKSLATRDAARRRLAYQELFMLGLALAVKRHQQQATQKAPPLEATAQIDARIRRLFPFDLTTGQKQAISEIGADMARSVPMNRLLQGDVGSGKTIVALYAMLLAVAHGHQAVLMAPTEVLARQHMQSVHRILTGSQVRRAEFLGGMTTKLRSQRCSKKSPFSDGS